MNAHILSFCKAPLGYVANFIASVTYRIPGINIRCCVGLTIPSAGHVRRFALPMAFRMNPCSKGFYLGTNHPDSVLISVTGKQSPFSGGFPGMSPTWCQSWHV